MTYFSSATFSRVCMALVLSLWVSASFAQPRNELQNAPPRFGTVNMQQIIKMRTIEEDAPFYMVNLIKYRERASYRDGRETDITGEEADALYSPLEFLAEIGAKIIYVGKVENILLPPGGTEWDRIAIVLYPSREKFFAMAQNPAFQARAINKEAGIEKTIVMVTNKIDLPMTADLEPSAPKHPATADDPTFDMVHLLHYNDQAQYAEGSDETPRTGAEAMQLYSSNAGSIAVPLGVRPVLWLKVEGAIIGDGREWDEFRINRFPSHATFAALTGNPAWAAKLHHRQAALEDTYAIQVLPLANIPTE